MLDIKILMFSRLESVKEYYRVLRSVTECYRVLRSVTKCYRKKRQKRPNLARNWHFWKTTIFGPRLAFLVIWARPCWLIWCSIGGLDGGCGAQALSRKTPTTTTYLPSTLFNIVTILRKKVLGLCLFVTPILLLQHLKIVTITKQIVTTLKSCSNGTKNYNNA